LSDKAVGEQPQADAELALARRRVAALFTRDSQGELLTLNELEPVPPPTPAPRVYIGVTTGGIVHAYRQDVSPALRVAIEQFCAGAVPLAYSREDFLLALRAVLDTHDSSGEAWAISSGPAFVFPEVLPIACEVTLIEPGREDLLVADFPFTATWLRERWPCYGVVIDDRAVSVCYSARRTADVAEAGVDTAEEFRGRGYATLVTTAWANAIRAAGITPVYSTDDENRASRAVARKLGLREFGWDVLIT
jgi:GNAT superfamily N-acetyltransferase